MTEEQGGAAEREEAHGVLVVEGKEKAEVSVAEAKERTSALGLGGVQKGFLSTAGERAEVLGNGRQ